MNHQAVVTRRVKGLLVASCMPGSPLAKREGYFYSRLAYFARSFATFGLITATQ